MLYYISVKLLKVKWFSGINNSPFVLFLHLASKKSLSCLRSTIPFVLIYTILCVKLLQSRLTLCDPMDCSPLGCCVCGILQAGIVEWIAMPSSRESSRPRDRTQVSCVGRQVLYLQHHLGSPEESDTTEAAQHTHTLWLNIFTSGYHVSCQFLVPN